MFKPKLLVLALSATLALSACSSKPDYSYQVTENAVAPTSLNPQTKNARVNEKDAVVYIDEDERRGAAIEQGSDKHFLHKTGDNGSSPLMSNNVKYNRQDPKSYVNSTNNSNSFEKQAKSALGNAIANLGTKVSDDKRSEILGRYKLGESKDYSYYELSRWQRFCDNGKNMDRLDWKFVKSYNNVFPKDMLDTCELPSMEQLRKHGMLGKKER